MERYVCDKNNCTGCRACVDACNHNAITVIDGIVHYNAVIDSEKCVECGLCKKACPQLSRPLMRDPVSWCQGWTRDECSRATSASGGIAAEIQKRFIETGGVVCSCVFREGTFPFVFAETIEEAQALKGSKYVKSDPTGAYNRTKSYIGQGKKVLFVGLPCQVAAMNKAIQSPLLYTIDLICHGTPSPRLLGSYLDSCGVDIKKVNSISFRRKTGAGRDPEEHGFSTPWVSDPYSVAFHQYASLTESCYPCNYAIKSRSSDLTIGDSWGSTLPIEERKKGISLILCQTEKGKELLDNDMLDLRPVDIDTAIKKNPRLDHPVGIPRKRDDFMREVMEGRSLNSSVRRYYPKVYCKNLAKKVLSVLHLYPSKKKILSTGSLFSITIKR